MLHPIFAVHFSRKENCHFEVNRTGKEVGCNRNSAGKNSSCCICASTSGLTESLSSSICSPEHCGVHRQQCDHDRLKLSHRQVRTLIMDLQWDGTPGQLHASFVSPEHKGLGIWPKRLDPELESFSFQHSRCTVEFTFGQDLPDPCGQCQALEQAARHCYQCSSQYSAPWLISWASTPLIWLIFSPCLQGTET